MYNVVFNALLRHNQNFCSQIGIPCQGLEIALPLTATKHESDFVKSSDAHKINLL